MGLRSAYLFLYNSALSAGWAYVIYLTYDTLLRGGSLSDVWQAVEVPLKVSQTAAVLEVVHAALGVVRSPVAITATQVASRLWALWGLVDLVPERCTQLTVGLGHVHGVAVGFNLATLLTAWALSEVIRYSFFATKELGATPHALLWLRYTAFTALYPVGVASELSMAWLAGPAIKARKLLTIELPNPVNLSFDYYLVCWVIAAAYLPGLPQLYGYMLAQRRKLLGGGAAASNKAAVRGRKKQQ